MVDIYQENILEHYRNPLNFGKMGKPTVIHRELNPLCGDDISVSLKIRNNKVEDIKFTGNGCAISRAAMSMLTEHLKGRTLKEVMEISTGYVIGMLEIPIGVVRLKCATLGLSAVKKAVEEYELRNKKSKSRS